MKLFSSCLHIILASLSISISFAQTANFSANSQKGCAPLTVAFTNSSIPINGSFVWDFGNGNTSTEVNPQATYTNPGTYTVSLSVNGSAPKTMTIRVFKNPVVDFSATTVTSCAPATIQFNDKTTPGDTTYKIYEWYYGDNIIGNTLSHTYEQAGKFDVYLKVEDYHGCSDTTIKRGYIDIAYPPNANFNATPSQACFIPTTVRFLNTTPHKPYYTYKWSTTSGMAALFKRDTSFTFTKYGADTVTMTVTDSKYGCWTEISQQYLVYEVNAIGTLKQNGVPITNGAVICAGNIEFNSRSVPKLGNVKWDFGDNSISDDTLGTHYYGSEGTYTVRLIASPGSDCADTIKWTFTVEKTVPDFKLVPEKSCQVSSTIAFTNTSTNAVSYSWEFNDGTTSTETNPTITYSVDKDKDQYVIHKDSSFVTTLTATSLHGCKVSKSKAFTIKRPTALFSVNKISGCAPLSVTFKDKSLSDSTITNRGWLFGDGNSDNLAIDSVIYTFNTPGVYDSKLIITNNNGCKDTSYVIIISVGQAPAAGFNVLPATVCQFDSVAVSASFAPGTVDYWEYTVNGTPIPACSNENLPSFKFKVKPATGILNINQKLGYRGCYSEASKTITNNGPISKFTYQVIDCNNPYKYKFTGSPSNATIHQWKIDNVVVANTKDIAEYTFTIAPPNKDYTVMYITSNGAGCSDTMTQTVRVRQKVTTANLDIPTQACAYQTIQAKLNGTAPSFMCSEKYIWNFNDSTPVIRTDKNILDHTYSKRGTFAVKVTILNDNGCTDSISQNIRIYKPFAGLRSDVPGGCPGTQVTFTDTSKEDSGPDPNPIKNWTFYYGYSDETGVPFSESFTSKPSPIKLIYDQPNYYAAYMKVTDEKNCMDSAIAYIGIADLQPYLQSENSNACAYEDVIFTQNETELDSAVWDFGDGTILRSKVGEVSHPYVSAGNFNVKLSVYKFGCPGIETIPVFIEKADASFADSISDCPTLVKFTHSAPAANIQKGTWSLGDGKTKEYEPLRPYVYNTFKPGTYTVELTVVTEANNCADTVKKSVKIPGPKGAFSVNKKVACKGEPLNFTIKDTADLTSFEFDYGDGSVDHSQLLNLSHSYSQTGKKYVALVMYQNTCKYSASDSIEIEKLIADFNASETEICENVPVKFTNTSVGHVSQFWSLGPGKQYIDPNPPQNLTYTIGTYPIYLAVTSASGCKDTARKVLNVHPDFKLTLGIDTSLCDENKVKLTATGGNSIIWTPADALDNPTSFTPIITSDITRYFKAKATRISCSKQDSILVYFPKAKFSINGYITKDTIINMVIGETIPISIIDTSSIKTFTWTPTTDLSCTNCLDLVASPYISTNYYLVLTEPNGCLSDTLYARMIIDNTKINWGVPEAFTPGRGSNGLCMLKGKGIREILEFKIFNRWGNVVFSTTDKNNSGWDGKYQGKDQPVDSYVWTATVKLGTNEVQKKKGAVLLLR